MCKYKPVYTIYNIALYLYHVYNIYILIHCYTHCRLRFQFHLSFMFGWICEPQWPPGSIQLDKKKKNMNSIEIHPPPAIHLSTIISNVPCLNHYYIANGSITQLFHIKHLNSNGPSEKGFHPPLALHPLWFLGGVWFFIGRRDFVPWRGDYTIIIALFPLKSGPFPISWTFPKFQYCWSYIREHTILSPYWLVYSVYIPSI